MVRATDILRPSKWGSSPIVILLYLATLLCITTSGVQADGRGLHCEDVWNGPSSDNDIMECITNTGRVLNTAGNYILPVLCMLFLIVVIFAFPIIFFCCVCCQCCCDCCMDVPVEKRESSRRSRTNLLVILVILLLLSVAILLLIIIGCSKLEGGASDIFDNVDVKVVGYLESIVADLKAKTYDNSTGTYTEPFKTETFTDIETQIDDIQSTVQGYRGDVRTYSEFFSKVGYGVAVFPLFVFSFAFLFAACNVRRCCPSCCACIYWGLSILFALIGFILLILAAIMGDVCAEVDLQHERQPGMFQWFLIPKCENEANFTSIKEDVTSKEADFARDFCKEISKYCSNTLTYDPSSPDINFYCTTSDATAAADCKSFENATAILNNAFAKDGSPVCGGANCSFNDCPTACSSSTMQSDSAEALKILRDANRLADALDLVLPLMDCNVIVDRVLMALDSCDKIYGGIMMVGVAFFVMLICVMLGWISMFRGQKLWFTEEEYEEGQLTECEVAEKCVEVNHRITPESPPADRKLTEGQLAECEVPAEQCGDEINPFTPPPASPNAVVTMSDEAEMGPASDILYQTEHLENPQTMEQQANPFVVE